MIYICIPTHDEATTLGPLLWKVRRVLGAMSREFRLVIFDDASTDNTDEVLARYKGMLPIDVIKSESRVGYGVAVDRMLRHALEHSDYPKRDAAVVLQADYTDDPGALEELVKAIEGGADIVGGAVNSLTDAAAPKGVVWARRLAPWVLGQAWERAPADPICGLRAYRLIVLRKALREDDSPLATSDEPWAANLELLHRLVPEARRIEVTPIAVRYQMHARPSRFRATRVLKVLFRFRDRRWPDTKDQAA